MSIQSVAAELYSLKSKKNISISAAFSIMLREELAARMSVYNLVRVVTKSPLLATVAQYKFGGLTPLQKKEAEQENKRIQSDFKFKQFTASSIATLNKKINTLSAITQKNTQLIQSLYDQLGSSKFQRSTNVLRSSSALRVPGRSKTVKAQIEQIQKDIAVLSKQKVYTPKKRATTPKSKEEQKKENSDSLGGLLGTLIPLILNNPRMLAAVAGGAGGALALGSFALQAYSFASLGQTGGRILDRLRGERGTYTDPETGQTRKLTAAEEEFSQFTDPILAAVGTYTAGRVLTGAVSVAAKGIRTMRRKRARAAAGAVAPSTPTVKPTTAPAPTAAPSKVSRKKGSRGSAKGRDKKWKENWKNRYVGRTPVDATAARAPAATATASTAEERLAATAQKLKKVSPTFLKMLKVAEPIFKKLPGAGAAYAVYILGKIGEKNVEYQLDKTLTYAKFREAVIPMYGDLIETIGVAAFATIVGAIGGSFAGGPLGTIAGAGAGFLGGAAFSIASMFLDDPSDGRWTDWGAEKIFDLIYNDKKTIDVSGAATKSGQAAAPGTGPRSVRNNNPGNLRYSPNLVKPGYVLEKAVGADSGGFAIFATPQDGLEAMEKQVRLDTQSRGMTLAQFVNKYAPPNENDTNKYAKFVSERTGLMVNDRIPASKIPEVINAMILMEGGKSASQYYASAMGGGNRMLVASSAPATRPMAVVSATPVTAPATRPMAVASATPVTAPTTTAPTVNILRASTDVQQQSSVEEMSGGSLPDDLANKVDSSLAMSLASLGASQSLAPAILKMQSAITDLSITAKMNKEFYVDNSDSVLSNYRLT